MLENMYKIALGDRAGVLNRVFTILMILMVVIQFFRWFRFRLRLSRWGYRLFRLEQDAREEGVVTAIDPDVLPPLDPYVRFWDMVPSMAIMLGLLGTFIGLTLSLSEIPVTVNVEDIRKGLSKAIPSMGTAFWTSLCGLVVAIVVRILNAMMVADFRYKVVDKLMQSEPQVIDALETAAFQQGRDGALLRPHGIRELLWHQNRLLNQTVARVAPQVSEGITRGLAQFSQQFPMEEHKALLQELRRMTNKIESWQQQQNELISQQRNYFENQTKQIDQLIDQQKRSTRVLSQELAGFQQQIREMARHQLEAGAGHQNPQSGNQGWPTQSPSANPHTPPMTPHPAHTLQPPASQPPASQPPASQPPQQGVSERTVTEMRALNEKDWKK